MSTLIGTPAINLSKSDANCAGQSLVVPDVCEPCRQVDRWFPRTVAWTSKAVSRFGAILRAILAEHQDILDAYCGNCFGQASQTCECFAAEYALLGLPPSVEIAEGFDGCMSIGQPITIPNACDDTTACFLIDCADLCAYCDTIVLDPCNDPEHLDVMVRAVGAIRAGFGLRATGGTILAVVAAMFPGTTPTIRLVETGVIYIDIGRPFTTTEGRFYKFLSSLIPLGFGVSLVFVTSC